MKKLINDPNDVLSDMLAGIALTNSAATVLDDSVVVRSDLDRWRELGQVALISGGGSGHEPAHVGYVGPGMLTGAVCGDVFSSPSADAVLTAIRAVGGAAGVLLIVKSYTGDRLNFGLAAEIARSEGIPVEMVVVGDDAALARDGDHAGRRGLAGTVLVHKVAGAAAAAGLPLTDVAREAARTAAGLATMGVALTACTVPAAGEAGLDLGADELEWGLGIHGEPGVERGPVLPADVIVDRLVGRLLADQDVDSGDRVALLVNNLGGTPAMELTIVAGRAVAVLADSGVTLERVWVGTFLTALEMAGCSLSLLRVDDQALARLDTPTQAPAWPVHQGAVPQTRPTEAPLPEAGREQPPEPLDRDALIGRVILEVAEALIASEDELTDLDQRVGDGDLGVNLARGARAVQEQLPTYDGSSPASVLHDLAGTVRRVVGGTSGPLYAALLLRAANHLASVEHPSPADWSAAFAGGVAAVSELGGARPGDRTMLDALGPAAEALASSLRSGVPSPAALDNAVSAARKATDATAGALARRGRSSYLGDRALGTPDPGCVAVVICLGAIMRALTDFAASPTPLDGNR